MTLLSLSVAAPQGFTAAFGLIFVSEIGDKTFFIAALLAMERGRAVVRVPSPQASSPFIQVVPSSLSAAPGPPQVLAGATTALAIMTIISVAIGRLFSKLPESFSSSIPIGEYLAVALLLVFGVTTLRVRLRAAPV